jgi:hypothetical protein
MQLGDAAAEGTTAKRPSFASLQAQINSLQEQIDQIPGIPTFSPPTCSGYAVFNPYYPWGYATFGCEYCTDCLAVVDMDEGYNVFPQSDLAKSDCGYTLENMGGDFGVFYNFTNCDTSSMSYSYMTTFQKLRLRVWNY